MKKLLVSLITISSFYLYGQNIDSLVILGNEILSKNLRNYSKSDVETILAISNAFKRNNVDSSLRYANFGLNISQKQTRFKDFEIEFTALIANGLNEMNSIDSSTVLLENALNHIGELSQDSSSNSQRGLLNQYLSDNYYDKGNLKEAVRCIDNAARYYTKAGNTEKENIAQYKLANYLLRLNQIKEASKVFYKILDSSDDPKIKGAVYVSLGIVESKKGNILKSIEYYNKAKNYNEYSTQPELVHMNLGISYRNIGKYEQSIEHIKNAENICLASGRTRTLPLIYNNMFKAYHEFGDNAMAIKALNQSRKYLKDDNLNELVGLNNNLTKLYESEKKYKLALESHKLKWFYKDSIEKIERANFAIETVAKYETEKKEAENQLLKKEKELQAQTISNQKYAMAGATGGLGLLGFISYLLYRQSNERKRKNKILAQQRDQIDALHKDLAHRVKNNLFFVSTLMKMQANKMDNSEAKQAIMEGEARIEAMSLLHRKLNLNKGSERIDMAEYIGEICDNLRYSFPYEGNRPAIKFDSDELYIDGESAMRIGLIINELVTNSFKHAFKDVDNPIINIHIKSINPEKYSVHYTDNGVGMESTVNVDRSESMGLKLIHTLTKQLDGYVTINKPAQGTSFEFEFKTKTAA